MVRFRNLTIRQKITFILMGTTSLAVLAACVIFYALVINQYRQSYDNELGSLAKVVGVNCHAALVFDVAEDANNMLASLSYHPSIISAQVHTASGELFADYSSNDAAVVGAERGHSLPGVLRVQQELVLDGSKIGTITLVDDMRVLHAFNRMATVTVGVVVAMVLGLTFLLAGRLREIIAQPISELAALSRRVTEEQDYSLRAVKHGTDEVGNLVEAFNRMLLQIEERNVELLGSEHRFRTLVNQAVDAFSLHDEQGRFVDANKRACESLGYNREELLAMNLADVEVDLDRERYREKYWQALAVENPITTEAFHRSKDGATFPVEVRMGLLELGDQRYVMAMSRDISERLQVAEEKRQLENQLQQAHKMESIGTLAGGIAHDFNNILSPIFGYLELALLRGQDDAIKVYLQHVLKAANRARGLVQQILTFSRQEVQKQAPIEMDVIVKEALKLLRATIPANIEIVQQIGPDRGLVLANPTQIHQILMNLCTNAYYAMRETGGVLRVALTPVELNAEMVRNINLNPGKYLRLEVSDTGSGMDEETLSKIFDPFFSTKPMGDGTGLGLSVVHGIVKNHGGSITVVSELGEGTTFYVFLPVAPSAGSAVGEKIPTTEVSHAGNEHILLVDDEKEVVNMEKEMLGSFGYRVTVCTCPEEALQLFRTQPEVFDLVITDMTMPKMTGDHLASAILAIRADMPVILCTGFSEKINKDKAMAMGIREYVVKPFDMNDFVAVVRKVLGAGGRGD